MREYETICKQNEEASVQACLQLIDSLYASVSNNIQSGEFAQPGGYEAYKKEMNSLEMKYMNTPRKGIMVSTSTQLVQKIIISFLNQIYLVDIFLVINLSCISLFNHQGKRRAE